MNLLTIADNLAARYAPGVVTPPAGLKNITAATSRPPNNIPNTPFVIAWPQSGEVTYLAGSRDGEHSFDVCFYHSKAEGDTPREYVALMSWLGVLLDQLNAQMQLGLGSGATYTVKKAIPMNWAIGVLTYGGVTYEAITLTVHVWTTEPVTLTP